MPFVVEQLLCHFHVQPCTLKSPYSAPQKHPELHPHLRLFFSGMRNTFICQLPGKNLAFAKKKNDIKRHNNFAFEIALQLLFFLRMCANSFRFFGNSAFFTQLIYSCGFCVMWGIWWNIKIANTLHLYLYPAQGYLILVINLLFIFAFLQLQSFKLWLAYFKFFLLKSTRVFFNFPPSIWFSQLFVCNLLPQECLHRWVDARRNVLKIMHGNQISSQNVSKID